MPVWTPRNFAHEPLPPTSPSRNGNSADTSAVQFETASLAQSRVVQVCGLLRCFEPVRLNHAVRPVYAQRPGRLQSRLFFTTSDTASTGECRSAAAADAVRGPSSLSRRARTYLIKTQCAERPVSTATPADSGGVPKQTADRRRHSHIRPPTRITTLVTSAASARSETAEGAARLRGAVADQDGLEDSEAAAAKGPEYPEPLSVEQLRVLGMRAQSAERVRGW